MVEVADVSGSFDDRNRVGRKTEAYPALDWLRMMLAGMVALAHSGVVLPAPFGGYFAVEVFLALSGWLIGGILIRSDRGDLPRFFYNRTTRIWFPYAAAILILYGFAILRGGVTIDWLKYLFYDVTFTHYNFVRFPRALTEMPLGGSGNQFWSLAVEEQFYLVAPIFLFAFPMGKRLLPWIVLCTLAMTLNSIAAPLTVGVVAAILQRDHRDWHLSRRARTSVIVATIALGLAAHQWDISFLRALFAGGIVLSLAVPGQRGGLGMFLGAISYPFYLNHWLGGFIAHGIGKHVPLSFLNHVALAFVISFAISVAAWALIDRPVLRHRGAWFSEIWGKRAAITAYTVVVVGLVGGLLITRSGG